MKRVFCILLCCFLLLSIVPRPVSAVEAGIVSVAVDAFASSALLGLGILPKAGFPSEWNSLVNKTSEFLINSGIAIGGLVTLTSAPELGGSYIPRSWITNIRDWLVGTALVFAATVSDDGSYITPSSTPFTVTSSTAPVYYINVCTTIVASKNYRYCSLLYSTDPFSLTVNNVSKTSASSGSVYYYSLNWYSIPTFDPEKGTFLPIPGNYTSPGLFAQWIMENSAGGVVVAPGIAVGDVIPLPDRDIETNYATWGDLALAPSEVGEEAPPDGDDDKTHWYWPIWVPSQTPEFNSDGVPVEFPTQEEIWREGAGTDSPPVDDPSTSGILGVLQSIWNWLKSLPSTIMEGLANLFVPDPAELKDAVDKMSEKFPFFNSIIATWKGFQITLSGGPPVVYAHLENAEGHYNYGGTVAVLDMSFYSRYKSYGDAILSAALWAFFAWRVFAHLPGIINGVSSDIESLGGGKKW